MYKQFDVYYINLIAKNCINFGLIYIFLINCFINLSAIPINKSFQFCPSIALPSKQSRYESIHMSDELKRVFELNYSLKLFGLNKSDLLSKRRRHNIPPQYMLDLYSSVSNPEDQNLMKYNSKTIISVSHSDTSGPSNHLHFYFNLSQLFPINDTIIEAEFHIYKLKSHSKHLSTKEDPKHNLLEVKVYQILSKEINIENRLLDVRRMTPHSMGWDVFYVKQAVLDWVHNHSTNYGLLISVKTLLNEDVDNEIRFANRYHNHVNKQPMLVVFTTDHRMNPSVNKQNQYNSKYDYGFIEFNGDKSKSKESGFAHTVPNKMPSPSGSSLSSLIGNKNCYRREIYIDFEFIGWSASMIAPKGYTASICEQKCTNSLNRNIFAKRDTTLDALYVGKGCCASNQFNSLNVLYFDKRGNVVLKHLDPLLINSCRGQLCH